MPLAFCDRHGIFSLPLIFILNIAVSITATILLAIEPLLAGLFLWFYVYYLLLQTRLMALLVGVCAVGGSIAAQFSPEVSVSLAIYSAALLGVSSVVAHGFALVVSYLTGFRI